MALFTFLSKIGHSIAFMRYLFKIQTEHKIHFRSHFWWLVQQIKLCRLCREGKFLCLNFYYKLKRVDSLGWHWHYVNAGNYKLLRIVYSKDNIWHPEVLIPREEQCCRGHSIALFILKWKERKDKIAFVTRTYTFNLVMTKASDKCILRNILQNTWPVLLNIFKWLLNIIGTKTLRNTVVKLGLGDMKINAM